MTESPDKVSSQEFEIEKRAIQRERFIEVLELMEDKKIEIDTYKGASVTGIFRSIDYGISNIHVNSLQTPIGCIPEALIRTSDIVKIKYQITQKK